MINNNSHRSTASVLVWTLLFCICLARPSILLAEEPLVGSLAQNHPKTGVIENLASKSNSRPNVLLMMVDDLGFSDIGCYGSEIKTPNLDRLASNGIKFTQFYNCAKCETTRSTLLSGRYYPEVGNQKLQDCITLAEGMKLAGYRTLMTGKWHLQKTPMDRGFDRYFGHLSGATNFFTGDGTFRLNHEHFEVPKTGFYTTDANIDYAIKFLDENGRGEKRKEDEPFFLYIAFNAPHYPLQAPESDVRKYLGKYLGGWDQLRNDRFARQQKMGLLPTATKLTDRPADVPAWSSLTPKQQEHEDLMMATFAAMVDRVDQNIGRLLKHLEQRNELDNTLIIFLSDNGACPFQRSKAPTIKNQLKPWDPKSFWTYDKGWAHACNTPFREYKQNQHEGGINTPFIVHWPSGIESAMRGKMIREPAHLVDIMPTLLEVGETKYPETYQGKPVGPARGISLIPLLSGKPLDRESPLLFSFYGKNNAMRKGDMKMVNIDFGEFELFDISKDRTELKDLAKSEPKQFAVMKKELVKAFEKVGFQVRQKPKNDGQKKRANKKKKAAKQ